MRCEVTYEKQLVIEILSGAFQDNQSVNYLVPRDNKKVKRIGELMGYSYEMCTLFGKIYLSDDNKACALISFPEQKRTTFKSILAEIHLIVNSIGFANINKAIQREKAISKYYPDENIYYFLKSANR